MTAQAIPVQQLDELHGHRWLLAATELSGKTAALLACTDSREESEESSQHGCEGLLERRGQFTPEDAWERGGVGGAALFRIAVTAHMWRFNQNEINPAPPVSVLRRHTWPVAARLDTAGSGCFRRCRQFCRPALVSRAWGFT